MCPVSARWQPAVSNVDVCNYILSTLHCSAAKIFRIQVRKVTTISLSSLLVSPRILLDAVRSPSELFVALRSSDLRDPWLLEIPLRSEELLATALPPADYHEIPQRHCPEDSASPCLRKRVQLDYCFCRHCTGFGCWASAGTKLHV